MLYLVADYYNLDIRRDTLSIRFDQGLTAAATTMFDGSELRLITVGPGAHRMRRRSATPSSASSRRTLRPCCSGGRAPPTPRGRP